MKKYILITILFILFGFFVKPVSAQNETRKIKIESPEIARQNERLSIAFDMILNDVNLQRNNLLIVTPVLRSNSSADSLELAPVAIPGKTREKVIRRNNKFGNPSEVPANVQTIIERKNNTPQHLRYSASPAYSPWMQNASLALRPEMTGCAGCKSDEQENELLAIARILTEVEIYNPSFKLTYIVPEVEPVKSRSDSHSATFNFVVDRYELVRSYKDNASRLNEVDRIIGEIQGNNDINITEFKISGFASPEGRSSHNQMLAENRAKAFADYLVTKFDIPRDLFVVESYGSDWDGLRNAVVSSSLSEKDAILRIIDGESDPDKRDASLRNLSSGSTFQTLLKEYYPALRRTDYSIAYVVRSFDVEEAKKIIKTNPKMLSLNEMYLVAESYPEESKEFKEIFDIAAKIYPDNEIAVLNSAAAEIQAGNYDAAISKMENSPSKEKMLNNLALAYFRKGDVETAQKYFSQAAQAGDADARFNLEELEKHLKSKE